MYRDYFSGARNVYTVHAPGTDGVAPTAPLADFESNSIGAEIEEGTSMLKLTGTSRGLPEYVAVAATRRWRPDVRNVEDPGNPGRGA